MLSPILVAGCGRSGTTAVMGLLGTDPRVAFDRDHPFEHRYLTYYAKLASILEERTLDERFTTDHLYEFEESVFGPFPWSGPRFRKSADWLRIFWELFCERVEMTSPAARFYAEKAPAWLPTILRQVTQCSTIYVFRDPRDVYLSSNGFKKKKADYLGFARSRKDTDLDRARNLGCEFLEFLENWYWNREQEDSFLLRYEDLVPRPEGLMTWLRNKGLEADLARALECPNDHRTSSDTSSSVNRWRREGVPKDVVGFFEQHLGREMERLGYAVDSDELMPSIEFRVGALNPEQISCSDDRWVELQEDAMTVRLAGDDFWMLVPCAPFRAKEYREVWVSAVCSVGDHFSIYWRNPNNHFTVERRIRVDYLPSPHWRVVRFPMWQHASWEGTIQEIRLHLFNSESGSTEGAGYIRWVRLVR